MPEEVKSDRERAVPDRLRPGQTFLTAVGSQRSIRDKLKLLVLIYLPLPLTACLHCPLGIVASVRMCGIVAVVSVDGSSLDTQLDRLEGRLDEALEKIEHRGPDGRGIWVDDARNIGEYRPEQQ